MDKRMERLRCYVERTGNEWQAYCADADVRASGRSAGAARTALRHRLEAMVETMASGARLAPAPVAVRLRYQMLRLGAWRRGRLHRAARASYDFYPPPEWLPGLA